MRSLIAALRTLVLPFGATSGQRIILDGVNGRIEIYDASGNLRIRLGATPFAIDLSTGDAAEVVPAEVFASALGSGATRQLELFLESPNFSGIASQLLLLSNSFDTTRKARIILNSDEFELGGFNQAVLLVTDTLGGSRTLDIQATDLQLNSLTLPRGKRDKAESTTDVTLSTTAGTFSTLVEGTAFTPVSGRRYKLSFWAPGNMLIGGSGFATTDTWQSKFQVSVGGGAYADLAAPNGPAYIARAPVAQAFRYPIPDRTADYVAASASTLRFKVVATKASGAATVTSTLEADFHLLVEDVGI